MSEETPIEPWASAQAPGIEAIEAIAAHAFGELPVEFRALCDGLIIRVFDFPEEETLRAMEAQSEFELLGLFQGRGLAHRGARAETGEFPNMIWLYRRPLLDFWCEGSETLGAVISHVLVHEIGHHFGLSDEDMEAIEAGAQ